MENIKIIVYVCVGVFVEMWKRQKFIFIIILIVAMVEVVVVVAIENNATWIQRIKPQRPINEKFMHNKLNEKKKT